MAAFLVVALRWHGLPRSIAVGLYVYRLVGFVAFELTGERALLLVFPSVFELWFLLVAAAGPDRVASWSAARVVTALLALTAAKEVQEWAIHGAPVRWDQLAGVPGPRLATRERPLTGR